MTIAYFDGAIYHLESIENKSKIRIGLEWPCYKQLQQYDLDALLQREYGDMVVAPPQG